MDIMRRRVCTLDDKLFLAYNRYTEISADTVDF